MRDPVTGFDYPKTWVEKCQSRALLPLVEQGLAILTSSGSVLRRGYTTGTTAAAACKAAVQSLKKPVGETCIKIPACLTLTVPVTAAAGKASCRKYAGDYPSDFTAGIEFVAEARPVPEGITLTPGEGIGRFSRDVPRYPKGTPAISPTALACILAALQEAVDETGLEGVSVRLSVPEGALVAKKTLNSRVGVEGGISVLGTTGLVEPWDDHLTESVMERIVAADHPVLTTGRIGLRFSRLLFPDREIILVGGKIAEALAAAKDGVILCGLPALILRFINPHILDNTGSGTVEELMTSPDFSWIMKENLNEFKLRYPSVHVVLIDREGCVIGESP